LPYYDDDTRRFLESIVVGQFKPITEWVPDLDPHLVRIVERMIAKRDRRYREMKEVVRDLRRWLVQQEAAEPPAAFAPPPAAPPPLPSGPLLVATAPRSSSWTMVFGAGAVAALL